MSITWMNWPLAEVPSAWQSHACTHVVNGARTRTRRGAVVAWYAARLRVWFVCGSRRTRSRQRSCQYMRALPYSEGGTPCLRHAAIAARHDLAGR